MHFPHWITHYTATHSDRFYYNITILVTKNEKETQFIQHSFGQFSSLAIEHDTSHFVQRSDGVFFFFCFLSIAHPMYTVARADVSLTAARHWVYIRIGFGTHTNHHSNNGSVREHRSHRWTLAYSTHEVVYWISRYLVCSHRSWITPTSTVLYTIHFIHHKSLYDWEGLKWRHRSHISKREGATRWHHCRWQFVSCICIYIYI